MWWYVFVEFGFGGRIELLMINKYSWFNNVFEEWMVYFLVGYSIVFFRFV